MELVGDHESDATCKPCYTEEQIRTWSKSLLLPGTMIHSLVCGMLKNCEENVKSIIETDRLIRKEYDGKMAK